MKKKFTLTWQLGMTYLILWRGQTMKDFRLKLFTGALIVLLSLSMIMVPSASHALLDDNYRTGDDPGTGTGEPASSGDLFRGTETGTDSTSYGLLTGGKDGLLTGNSLEFSYPKKAMLSGVPRYFQKHMTCSDLLSESGSR